MPRLDLYSRRLGKVPTKSGLNWSKANAHVCEGDGYVTLTREFLRRYPNFFPPNGRFMVTWDDGVTMMCSVEGTQEIDGYICPNKLTSANIKSVFGTYLRNRLGVSKNKLVTLEDLDRYGRRDIEITKTTDGRYYIDFSVE